MSQVVVVIVTMVEILAGGLNGVRRTNKKKIDESSKRSNRGKHCGVNKEWK
jgi:deoxycytidylate deaminase